MPKIFSNLLFIFNKHCHHKTKSGNLLKNFFSLLKETKTTQCFFFIFFNQTGLN